MELARLQGDSLSQWDPFIRQACNGSLFHERAFLAYHGDRFHDQEQFLAFVDKKRLLAGIALAITEEEQERRALSPYGGSFGGIVYLDIPDYRRAREMADHLIDFLQTRNVARCRLTPPIDYLPQHSTATGTFALLEAGFHLVNRDVSSVVYLDAAKSTYSSGSKRLRRAIAKAEQAGVEIIHDVKLDEFWPVLEATFERHASRATHTRAEFEKLTNHVGERVRLSAARLGGQAIAAIAVFGIRANVDMTFYLCQTDRARDCQAMSLLLGAVLDRARDEGKICVDLGTASYNMSARPGVFEFKENFSRTGLFRETYEWVAS